MTFADLQQATTALPDIIGSGAAAIELSDATSLRVTQGDPRADAELRSLRVAITPRCSWSGRPPTPRRCSSRRRRPPTCSPGSPSSSPSRPSRDAAAHAALWTLLKKLYPAVAGARPSGTTALLEDIAVPPGELATTCEG